MEKSSEKVIGSNKLSPNPFNNLLSEVQIKINQPKSTKKIENYALEMDSKIDRSGSNINEQSQHPAKKENNSQRNSKIAPHHVYVINAPLKTKNSSDTLNKQKSRKDIIDEWIVGYMSKHQLLGLHWEDTFASKKSQLLEFAFDRIKKKTMKKSNEQNSFMHNIQNLSESYTHLQKNRLKECFSVLKQFYKDDLLFGLSNTIGQERDHSEMQKIDNDYESLSIESKNFKKQSQNIKIQQYSFSEHSQSNRNLTKKESGSVSGSQDLSNLILNHNKLKLEEDLNKSVPNIPKSKNSLRSTKTNKQIGDLCLQTRKQIITQKNLGEDYKTEDLPLQSNRNLIRTKKNLNDNDNLSKIHENQVQEKKPITITFVLNDLKSQSLINGQNKCENPQGISRQQKKSQKEIKYDQNLINNLPFAQSFYQNANAAFRPAQIIQKIDIQKRSTSLQIKPGYYPLFPEMQEIPVSNSAKRIFANEYYPEQSNRENVRFAKESIPLMIEKTRPKSATPKITFTFTSNNNRVPHVPSNLITKNPTQSRVLPQTLNHPQYDHHDYIVESVLKPHSQPANPISGSERSKHKLQVISPSRNAQSPKRMVPPNKLALQNREHIKNNILPPAFNDYYGAQNGQRSLKAQKSNGKIVLMENEIVYSDNFQISTAHNSNYGCSARASNLHHQERQQIRMKSPKDKLFVTYANPCHL